MDAPLGSFNTAWIFLAMPDISHSSQHVGDSREEELAKYRPVSGAAVAALLLGISSPLAFIGPLLWAAPVMGVSIALLALVQLDRAEQPRAGRKAAVLGLVLSIVFGVAAPVETITSRWWLSRESAATADQWFELLARGQPEMAYQLTLPPAARPLLNGKREAESDNPDERRELDNYIAGPLVKKLLALGEQARPRYGETAALRDHNGQPQIWLIYQVTSDEHGTPSSFYVLLVLERSVQPETGLARWQIMRTAGRRHTSSIEEWIQ
jgi:hypothetical protein